MRVLLTKQEWSHNDSVWVTGFVRESNHYLSGQFLLNYFSGIDTTEDFERKLLSTNGQFSVVIKKSGEIWAATDRLRNYPLFYTIVNEEFILSDDCYVLADVHTKRGFKKQAVDSFIGGGFTLNNLTLIDGIFQVEAGELIITSEKIIRKYYHKPSRNSISRIDFDLAASKLLEVFNEVFEGHIGALKDNFIAVPLSGGYDSRLVASMCALNHPQNVLCFTYGRENNREVALARDAASRLGLKWINIVYDSNLINGYMEDGYFNKYYQYASGLSSMFYMQDYFAVRYLKENNLIPENTVFIPGFSGDSLAGSFFTSAFRKHTEKDQLAFQIMNEKFGLINLDRRAKENIYKLICEKLDIEINECWKNYEEWEIKEIHAKLIVNSAKAFTFFGYKYVTPLFDNHLIDFFTSLPFDFKLNKRLYDYVLTQMIFKQLNVNLKKEINPKPFQRNLQRFKENIKHCLPALLIDNMIDLKSPILYDEITRTMIDEIGQKNLIKPRQANYYNSYLTQWYLFKTKEKYQIP